MKYSSLSNFVSLCTPSITLSGLPQSLSNNQVLVLFNSRAAKLRWYSAQNQHLNNSSTLIFNCGLHNESSFPSKSSVITSIVTGPMVTFDQLLANLNALLTISDPRQPVSHLTPSTIIIDDLSTYYWDLKSTNSSAAAYAQLHDVCGKLSQRLACNVIVTAWDNSFERGVNYNRSLSTSIGNQQLAAITFLPSAFMTDFDYVVVYMVGDETVAKGAVALFHHQWRVVGEF